MDVQREYEREAARLRLQLPTELELQEMIDAKNAGFMTAFSIVIAFVCTILAFPLLAALWALHPAVALPAGAGLMYGGWHATRKTLSDGGGPSAAQRRLAIARRTDLREVYWQDDSERLLGPAGARELAQLQRAERAR